MCADELSPLRSAEVSASNTNSTKVTNSSTLELERAQSQFILQVRDEVRHLRSGSIRIDSSCSGKGSLKFKKLNPKLRFFRPTLPASSKFYDSGIGTSMGRQSAHDESTLSHTSFASTAVEGETVHFRVPPTPAEVAQGKPFGCSICSQTLSLRSRAGQLGSKFTTFMFPSIANV